MSKVQVTEKVVKRKVKVAASRGWVKQSMLALLCLATASAFAQVKPSRSVPVTPAKPKTVALAAVPSDPQTELMTVIEPKYEMDMTSFSALGDDFNPTNGTVTFSVTDISIPGNFAIPVALRRWIPSDDADTGGPTGWKWNIPYIRGNFLDVKDGHSSVGWDWGGSETWRNGKNCTGSADTVIDNAGELIAPNAYWQGKLLHIPGVTSETFLTKSGGEQVTKSNFKIDASLCINNNPSGAQGIVQQGIVVKGPDGTTYTFNQIKTYYNGKTKVKNPIVRTRLLMITKIKDRFDNEVNYSYDASGRLTGISATDGRQISITYQNGEVYQASAHGRTWTYGTNSVTLPDGRQWNYAGLSALAFKPNGIGGYNQQVNLDSLPATVPGCTVGAGDYLVSINNPDGLLTTYKFRDTIHYRANVEPDLYSDLYSTNYTLSRAMYCTVARSLVSKTSTGPGVGPYTWNYTYSGNRGTYLESSIPRRFLTGPFDLPAPLGGYPAPISAGGGAINYRSVTVSGPDKRSVYYIDRQFQSISEERVVAQDTLNAAGTQLLERKESSFGLGALVGENWYMCPCEGAFPPVNVSQLSNHINQTQERRIRYVNGNVDATFSTTYPALDFDQYGRPKTIIRSGSLGAPPRTERLVYDIDNAISGVLGQVKSISIDGITYPMVENTYDPTTSQRTSTKKFGILQANFQYHSTGTDKGNLWTHTDGLNNKTTYTNYRRGQPQRIDRADGTYETATINDWGLVAARVDPNGHAWSYNFDLAQRLEKITPPTGWNHTAITYQRATQTAYGLPVGHWSQSVTKGNAKTVTYFDVMWRPLMVRTYDISNEANTRKVVVKTFDVGGQLIFESYPQRDFASVAVSSPGKRMQYDALGRTTRLEVDSDSGALVTLTEYLSGFLTRVTDPKLNVTFQNFWALDDPDQAQLATITAPEGVTVQISRDVLGKTKSITRSGTDTVTATRSYVYDVNQRLCKTIEPEVKATIQSYDAANNVTWRAAGINATSTSSCDQTDVNIASAKVSYEYDTLNRLKTTSYADSSPTITRTYTADGLPYTISTNGPGNPVWTSLYNSLRQLDKESLSFEGQTYHIGRLYDANGNLTHLNYPSQSGIASVDFAPNALGEASKIGSYASNLKYYPNNAVSGFTYGNGIVHTMTQNMRGLPQQSKDVGILNDTYIYDKNANVESITDVQEGLNTRNLTYDQLDRLKTATGFFGNASYTYDSLDNLKTSTVGGRSNIHTYNASTNLLSNISSSISSFNFAYNYDSQGNIIQRGTQAYVFDKGNRLTSATGKATYSYDGLGHRVKTLNADGSNQISVYTQAGQILFTQKTGGTNPGKTSYIYLNRHQIAEVKN